MERNCLFMPSFTAQEVAQVHVGASGIRFEGYHRPIVRLCGLALPHITQQIGQIKVRLIDIRLRSYRPLVSFSCLLKLPLCLQRIAVLVPLMPLRLPSR